ncbi:Tuftelin-interacting protein 11 [Boothiomyces macroporosus]|uniref:Tuftelin-interacting protein 11 n=1 Tax=Boothiomyces macroporosus TaxID=261099 RepID=A0AAD5UGU5_9FUNG|nr:Tuftelin-interacting protein 11 [Boothiomyces macroporosus]
MFDQENSSDEEETFYSKKEKEIYGDFMEDEPRINLKKGGIKFQKKQIESSSGSDSGSDSEGYVPVKRDRDEEEEEERPSFGKPRPDLGMENINRSEMENINMNTSDRKETKYTPKTLNDTKYRPVKAAPVVLDQEFGAFNKHTKGFGLKMLLKQGYVPGQGLGRDGAGIATPIEVNLRPQGAGLGMVEEKSKSTKKQEVKEVANLPSWKKSVKKRKPKYKTAQQIIAEQAESGTVPVTAQPTTTKIRDLTGKEEKIVTDMADLLKEKEQATERLPELLHNMKLLTDLCQNELLHIARQNRIEIAMQERYNTEIKATKELISDHERKLARLEKILEIALQVQQISSSNSWKLSAPDVSPKIINELFGSHFATIAKEYLEEYQAYNLDSLVVSIFTPVFKNNMKRWSPLENPTFMLDDLYQWSQLAVPSHDKDTMSLFEHMIYSYWLPKVRQAINNDWNPYKPEPVVELIENWSKYTAIIPPWLHSNIVNQLILPKLEHALELHRIKQDGYQIHGWVFPWLPILQESIYPLFPVIRRKFQVFFKKWHPTDDTALRIVTTWAEVNSTLQKVFTKDELQQLIVNSILPQLILYLRNEFEVDPGNQQIEPLLTVINWSKVIPSHLFSNLLQTEFFNKWQNVLWEWIKLPESNHSEISQWYTTWKTFFIDNNLDHLQCFKDGFRTGLDMINQGLSSNMDFVPTNVAKKQEQSAITELEFHFQDLVESLCADANIEFLPINKQKNGRDLYRMGKLLAYIDDDLLYCQLKKGEEFEFMDVEEAIELAK